MLQALENNDRLAEEVGVLKKIAAYAPPAPSTSDTIIGNFVRFADSWVTGNSRNKAAPLQIAANIQGLAAEVLKGDILALIDVAAFRDAIFDAIAQLVPTKAVFSYDFASTVTEPPDDKAIFQAQVGAPFVLTTRIEVDLLNRGKTEFTAAGSLGPFAIKLVGSIVDALTLRFGGASFTREEGPRRVSTSPMVPTRSVRLSILSNCYNPISHLATAPAFTSGRLIGRSGSRPATASTLAASALATFRSSISFLTFPPICRSRR